MGIIVQAYCWMTGNIGIVFQTDLQVQDRHIVGVISQVCGWFYVAT